MSYIIVFDIGRDNPSLRVKVNRMLNRIKAVMVQDSVWQSDDLEQLKIIGKIIKSNGGKVLLFSKNHAIKDFK